jgi:hypothetical protein
MSPDERDILCENLDRIILYSNEHLKSDTAFLAKIMKLNDHVNLETIRLSRMDKIKFIGDRASDDRTQAETILKENETKVAELQNSVNGFHTQSITILGIFSGLVIGFSTGSNLIVKTFENINNLNFFKMILYIVAIGFVLFNVLFMLMYCVSKISNHSIAVGCRNRDCNSCPRCNNMVAKLNQKYPYVLWFNILLILCIIVLIYIMARMKIIW